MYICKSNTNKSHYLTSLIETPCDYSMINISRYLRETLTAVKRSKFHYYATIEDQRKDAINTRKDNRASFTKIPLTTFKCTLFLRGIPRNI